MPRTKLIIHRSISSSAFSNSSWNLLSGNKMLKLKIWKTFITQSFFYFPSEVNSVTKFRKFILLSIFQVLSLFFPFLIVQAVNISHLQGIYPQIHNRALCLQYDATKSILQATVKMVFQRIKIFKVSLLFWLITYQWLSLALIGNLNSLKCPCSSHLGHFFLMLSSSLNHLGTFPHAVLFSGTLWPFVTCKLLVNFKSVWWLI